MEGAQDRSRLKTKAGGLDSGAVPDMSTAKKNQRIKERAMGNQKQYVYVRSAEIGYDGYYS